MSIVGPTWVENGGSQPAAEASVLVVMWLVVLFLLLAVAGISALLGYCNRLRSGMTREHVDPPSGDRQAPAPVTEVLLLAVETVDAAFVVDGVVLDDRSPLGSVGWPLAFRLRRPDNLALDELIGAMLTRWAAEDEIVRVAITGPEPRQRVSITNGASVLHLAPESVDDDGIRS